METRSTAAKRIQDEVAAPLVPTPTTSHGALVLNEEIDRHVHETNRRRRPDDATRSRSVGSRSVSSHASVEVQRRRVEFEAEVQLAKIKEDVIRKKLAMDIAEIEDEAENNLDIKCYENRFQDCLENVNDWLADRAAVPVHTTSPSTTALPHARPLPPPAPCVAAAAAAPPQPRPPQPPHVSTQNTLPGNHQQAWQSSIPLTPTTMPIAVPVNTKCFELPAYSGSPAEWLLFKRAYETTTHMYHLNDFENITRLQLALCGEAKCAVEDLLRSGSDPGEIMNALEQEFGHPNLLLECALQKMKGLPKVTEGGRELRKIATVVRNCVSLLRNIKADGYINNPQLVGELLAKLTPIQRAQYGEFVMKLDATEHSADLRVSPNLNIMVNFLNHLATASSYLPFDNAPRTTPVSQNINMFNTSGRRFNPPTVAGHQGQLQRRPPPPQFRDRVFANMEASSSPPFAAVGFVRCVLCNEYHDLVQCNYFLNMNNDDKWEVVKRNSLCFNCFAEDHARYQCREKRCDECRLAHHTLLHFTPAAPPPPPPGAAPARAYGDARAYGSARDGAGGAPASAARVMTMDTQSVTNIGERFTKTLLKVIPISILDKDNNEIDTYALLDDGATVSLIDESLATNLYGPISALRIISARGLSMTDENSRRVTTHIRGPNTIHHQNVVLRTIKNLNLPTQSIPASIMNNAYLRYLEVDLYQDAKPMILIGQDNWELIINDEIRRGRSGQPVASHTKLGWVVHGPIGCNRFENNEPTGQESVNFITERDDLHELVKKQFELESIGIVEVSRKNAETERALEILHNTSRRRSDGYWEVGLMWTRDTVNMPDNYSYAYKRLLGIEAKMTKDSDFAQAYTRQIDRLLEENYAKLIDTLPAKPVWYLPHFAVTNPNKPNKLRLVFDAAATYMGTSLNDNLLTGPDLLNSLLGVLFKFRQGPIAYTADIADMFLRIKIRVEDQGTQLFLWRKGDRKSEPDVYAMDSMIFGAKSSPTSAIYILNKNASEFEQQKPEAVRAIREKHYCDDYLDSLESIAEARQLIADVSEIHASGGFVIRGWVTNSPELRAELPTVVPGNVNLDRSPNSTERTLGMIWVPEEDVLKFDLSFKKLESYITDGSTIPTKREFLKFIMSVFDPLGILYPYTIRSKILLQRVWKSGIGWDERLEPSEISEWERLLQDVKRLVDVQIPRWYGLLTDNLELHVFGDASEQAYAAVAFIVGCNLEGQRAAAMVAGKARVAPLKIVSIPRLELQAAVLACRLACTVMNEFGTKITGKYLWTDSKTVLKWIQSDPRDYQKFVSHRLAEIDRKSNVSEWRWVPSTENPADEATKLHWPTNFRLWLTGPPFLLEPQSKWPNNEYEDENTVDTERVHRVCIVQQVSPLIDVTRFSSWIRALRTIARVIMFVNKCRKKEPQMLTADILKEAEIILIKQSQAESFPGELKAMLSGNSPSTESKLRSLDPFIHEPNGLLRVRGRISAAPHMSFDEKHPIILDGRCYTARLLINHFHKKVLHANNNTVINVIREKYWITHLRAAVKSVALKCQFCTIRRAMPVEPKMANLPSVRLEDTRRAFVYCAIDYFGPMEVAIGRRREKRWGVVFTCLVTRGIHLELAASLSADSAIMALRRLIARRGQPAIMYSDRGTNFVSCDAELRAVLRGLDHDKIHDYAANRGISWRFNPPAAPHMGGCWERLVRSVKAALKITLNERTPREEVLHTFLVEAELLINSRPLTYVETDPHEPIALTPNHLLLGTASGATTLGTFDPIDLDARKLWRKAQALADMFWHRWLKEYVPTLQKRQKWVNASKPIKVGDLVLMFDKNQPRNTWPRGVISKVYAGQDGQVRVVDVTAANGKIYKRPAVKVIVLPTDGGAIG